ncbi:15-hydroxyprostaglandin dehydrogenase [NAD(+)]-like [Cyclopterus lumpus]|uniref:15-hydroxyprostaglandin dehydrogenase [NAD(+)] n=1 Tax=Cyclopterus lumpus TaxID=8103 RepID=A0A8C3ABK3_CYCLU|nr:15-hydroxyprostaglandin dehydrogenase [NAD(+)]-like [Cyclopterus lumpus]
MSLNGKTAVVTGAALGIGRAITELLLQQGAKVALLDVNKTASESLMEVLHKQYGRERTLFLNCDVESEEQIKAAFQKAAETFGGIDIVCNNAGVLNEDTWEKTVSVNLMGVIRGSYTALEHMSKLSGGRGGVIINTASLAGLGPLPSCPVYTATKHAVVGFTRAMAAASTASGYGVRFNTLCPGFVRTDLFSSIISNSGRFSHLTDATQQLVEHFGIVDLADVAAAVLEMVTDETKNGEAFLVSAKRKEYVRFASFV